MPLLAIASEIKLYRESLALVLCQRTDMSIVASVSTAVELRDTLVGTPESVVLLDISTPNSLGVLNELSQDLPQCHFIALAYEFKAEELLACAYAGVAGYMTRQSSIAELIDAVLHCDSGAIHCPPTITQCMLKALKADMGKTDLRKIKKKIEEPTITPVADPQISAPRLASGERDRSRFRAVGPDLLTLREQEIARLVALGQANKEIAKTLCIELSTVKNHVHNILAKVGVKNRMQASIELRQTLSV